MLVRDRGRLVVALAAVLGPCLAALACGSFGASDPPSGGGDGEGGAEAAALDAPGLPGDGDGGAEATLDDGGCETLLDEPFSDPAFPGWDPATTNGAVLFSPTVYESAPSSLGATVNVAAGGTGHALLRRTIPVGTAGVSALTFAFAVKSRRRWAPLPTPSPDAICSSRTARARRRA